MSHRLTSGRPAGSAPWHGADTTVDDVILVDDGDVAIGTMPKMQAHRLGLRHRAVSVLLHDAQGRLLLHRRAAVKYHSAGLWTNTCCSHPRPGEHVLDAATRRLKEEMGILCALTPIFSARYRARVSSELIENEIVHAFGGRFEGSPAPNPDEVAEWQWVPLAEVARDVDQNPGKYTAWFRKYRHHHWPDIVRSVAGHGAPPQPEADAEDVPPVQP